MGKNNSDQQVSQETSTCEGLSLCLGGAKGIMADLLKGVDIRLAKFVQPKFQRFESELDAVMVGSK